MLLKGWRFNMLLEEISKSLGMPEKYIRGIANSARDYKVYYIPKKRGGQRKICHPSKQLKMLHYWLIENVLDKFPISSHSTAYEKGCSAVNNARIHQHNNFIFHTDIENFFESIKREHLEKLICTYLPEYSASDIDVFCKIVLRKGILPIGSVVAPKIANAVMYEFDERVNSILNDKYNLLYTRYADDIVISSKNYIPLEILEIIDYELENEDFKRNKDKTYFCSKSSRRQITGIVLDNNMGEITLGTNKLNALKKEIYAYLTSNQGDSDVIRGKLAYLKSINNRQYIMLKGKYSKYDDKNLLFKP
jgi:hypothetical protein